MCVFTFSKLIPMDIVRFWRLAGIAGIVAGVAGWVAWLLGWLADHLAGWLIAWLAVRSIAAARIAY